VALSAYIEPRDVKGKTPLELSHLYYRHEAERVLARSLAEHMGSMEALPEKEEEEERKKPAAA